MIEINDLTTQETKKPRRKRTPEEIAAQVAAKAARKEERARAAAEKKEKRRQEEEAAKEARRKANEEKLARIRQESARIVAYIDKTQPRLRATQAKRAREVEEQTRKAIAERALRELDRLERTPEPEPEPPREEPQSAREWYEAQDWSREPEPQEETLPGFLGFREDRPPEDELPPCWEPGHLMRRIVDAYRTLAALPMQVRPKGMATAWPSFAQEPAGEAVRQKRVALPEEIERMERVFGWQVALVQETESMDVKALFRWAACKAAGGDQVKLARSFGMPASSFRRYRRVAAERVCSTLNARSEPVF